MNVPVSVPAMTGQELGVCLMTAGRLLN
jgi:hypothetical protein